MKSLATIFGEVKYKRTYYENNIIPIKEKDKGIKLLYIEVGENNGLVILLYRNKQIASRFSFENLLAICFDN